MSARKRNTMEDVQIVIDGDPRKVPADLDAFTLYRMAGNPAVLVRLVNGQALYLKRTHSPAGVTAGSVFQSRRWLDGVITA